MAGRSFEREKSEETTESTENCVSNVPLRILFTGAYSDTERVCLEVSLREKKSGCYIVRLIDRCGVG